MVLQVTVNYLICKNYMIFFVRRLVLYNKKICSQIQLRASQHCNLQESETGGKEFDRNEGDEPCLEKDRYVTGLRWRCGVENR